MRYLAIDHGTRRMGIAISDELKMIAQPLEYIPSEPRDEFFSRLKRIIAEQQVELIVVGLPRNMDGTYGPAAEKVRAFVEVCAREIPLPIRTLDERLTSAQANRVLLQGRVRRKDRKEHVDKMAAAILLQSFLDAQPSGG